MPTESANFVFSLLASGVALMRSDIRLKDRSRVAEIYGTREICTNKSQSIHLAMTRVDLSVLLLDLVFADTDDFNHFVGLGLLETIVDIYFKEQCHRKERWGKSSALGRARTVQALIASKAAGVQLYDGVVDHSKLISSLTLSVTHFPNPAKQSQLF